MFHKHNMSFYSAAAIALSSYAIIIILTLLCKTELFYKIESKVHNNQRFKVLNKFLNYQFVRFSFGYK